MKSNILWSPSKDLINKSHITKFRRIINEKYHISLKNYSEMHQWSIDNIEQFWKELWNYSDIIYSKTYSKVKLNGHRMIDTQWFLESKLNYAENLLRYQNNNIAIYFFGEDEIAKTLTFNDLYKEVANVAYSLKKMGLKHLSAMRRPM